jgi:hypothetical protein
MNFNLALFLLSAAPSLASGALRGNGRTLYRSTDSSFTETLGQCVGATCGMWGDPHIVTCDGLKYDCQGIGIFTLMDNDMMNIQANLVDVGATEAELVAGWGLIKGASLTGDVVIDFKNVTDLNSNITDVPNPVPHIQLGFGEVKVTEPPSEKDCKQWRTFTGINMANQGRSVENLQSCRKRCETTLGCTAFSYWADGGCHLNDANQVEVDSNRGWSRAVVGYLENDCGTPVVPEDIPALEDDEESAKHGTIGPSCPLLMYVDGELQDLSAVGAYDHTYLLGADGDDYSVYKEGSLVKVQYKVSETEFAEVHLSQKGAGPGELWSCHWDFFVCLPAVTKDSAVAVNSVGLLGSVNGIPGDDWMTNDGLVIDTINTSHEDAFNYCVENWCVTQLDNIMVPHAGHTFEDHKCEEQPYKEWDIYDEVCIMSASDIINACSDKPKMLVYPCEVECCHGGCDEFITRTEEEICDNLPNLLNRDDDDEIQYNVPVHDDCTDTTFDKTGTNDDVCIGADIVTLLKSTGGVAVPEDQPIIYGITANQAPHDTDAGRTVSFKVNNPFGDAALDVYVKHEKSVFTTFEDTVCDATMDVVAGCDAGAVDVEVACHHYPDITPFALVQVYFAAKSGASGPGGDATVDKCCLTEPVEVEDYTDVVMYTFEIQCECPEGTALA